jgi:hypothetical protein
MKQAKTEPGIFVQIIIHFLFKSSFMCTFKYRSPRSDNRQQQQETIAGRGRYGEAVR